LTEPAPRGQPPGHWRARARRLRGARSTAIASRLLWPIAYPAAWLWRRTWLRSTRVVAVTGSYGKSSTAAAAAAALATPFSCDIPNYGAFLARTLLLHRRRRLPLVVEVGISRPGQMRGYARMLRPDVVILTALGADHVKAFGSRERLAREKAILAEAVRPGGLVVVNGDDPGCRKVAATLAARAVRVGFAAGCEWRLDQASVNWPTSEVRLSSSENSVALRLRWLGQDLARCAALGAVAALASGVAPANVAERLAGLDPLPGRLELLATASGARLLCDTMKASWETMESALRLLGQFSDHRRVAVLGAIEDLQSQQGAAFRELGRRAGAVAHRIVVVGARTDFERVRSGVRKLNPPTVLENQPNVAAAAAALRDELRPGTVILIKGRHSQKLERIAFLLRGESVDCQLVLCPLRGLRCALCPHLRPSTLRPSPALERISS
jgi:UDP-N-acetylmuramoyl-tripeptide--D-alanyl-D-alanine ligase